MLKYFYRLLLVLLSTTLLIILIELIMVKSLVFSETRWIEATINSQYNESVYASINKEIIESIEFNDVKKNDSKELVKQEDVDKDLSQFIINSFHAQSFYLKKSQIDKRLINMQNKDIRQQILEQSVLIYNDSIRHPLISMIGLRVNVLRKLLKKSLLIVFGLLICIVFCLYNSTKTNKITFLRSLSYIFTSIGLVDFLLFMLFFSKMGRGYFQEMEEPIKQLTSEVIKVPLAIQLYLSIIFLAIGIILSIYSHKKYLKVNTVRV